MSSFRTRATLRAKFTYGRGEIEVRDHLTGKVETVPVAAADGGHGGGDFGVVRSFVAAQHGEAEAMTNARESLESHLMAFAAEESRLKGTVVDMAAFREEAEKSTSWSES